MADTSTPAIHTQNISGVIAPEFPDGGTLGPAATGTASISQINSVCYSGGRDVPVTASTLVLTQAAYENVSVVLNRAAGQAVTLPAATGTGAQYNLYIGTTITSNTTTIQTATTGSGDVMQGLAVGVASALVGFATASTTNTITFNGTTQGGLAGTVIFLQDIAAGIWNVEIKSVGSGTGATPFSHV